MIEYVPMQWKYADGVEHDAHVREYLATRDEVCRVKISQNLHLGQMSVNAKLLDYMKKKSTKSDATFQSILGSAIGAATGIVGKRK